MRISPLDIRKQSFKNKMRGADPEEVRIFLDVVASEYEQVLQENAMMAERLRAQEGRLAEYRQLEKNMRDALVTTERIASESRDVSERESRRLVQDAHLRAERILEDARERLQLLIREIEMLRGKKEVFTRRFWTLIESQMSILQEHMSDMSEVDSLRQKVAQIAADAQVPLDPELGAGPPAESRSDDSRGQDSRSSDARDEGRRGAEARFGDPRATEARPTDGRAAAPWSGNSRPGDARVSEPPRAEPHLADSRHDTPRVSTAPWNRPARTADQDWSHPGRPNERESETSRPTPRDLEAPPAPAQRVAAGPPPPKAAEPETPRREMPKGLRGLLRGRQSQVPLPLEAPAAETRGSEPQNGDRTFADRDAEETVIPMPERREGFFEIRAGEGRDASSRFRGAPDERP